MGRPEHSRPWQQAASRATTEAIAIHAPRNTGQLAERIFVTISYEGGTTHLFHSSPFTYARYQAAGTGIYGPLKKYITPKRANFLSWVDKASGDRVYAKKVRGVKPTLFFTKALYDVYGPNQTTSHAPTGGTR